MIPEESRFEPDPEELVEPPEGLPEGWQVGTPDPDDLGDLRRLTELLRAHEREGRGWAAAGKEDVLVEVSDHGLRTRQNVVVRDEAGLIRAWGSVHDRASGRMLFLHVVERGLPEQRRPRVLGPAGRVGGRPGPRGRRGPRPRRAADRHRRVRRRRAAAALAGRAPGSPRSAPGGR